MKVCKYVTMGVGLAQLGVEIARDAWRFSRMPAPIECPEWDAFDRHYNFAGLPDSEIEAIDRLRQRPIHFDGVQLPALHHRPGVEDATYDAMRRAN